jgi:dsRNA-specific ribonuclease
MASHQLIDSLKYYGYGRLTLDTSLEKSKNNSFNVYQIGGEPTVFYNELSQHPLVYKSGIVDVSDPVVYTDDGNVRPVSRYTIIIWNLPNIKKLLGLEGVSNRAIMYVYTSKGAGVKGFVSSSYLVNGKDNTVYHKKETSSDTPFKFQDFGEAQPEPVESKAVVEVISAPAVSDRQSTDFSEISTIVISKSGLARRVPDVPLLVSEAGGISADNWLLKVKDKVSELLGVFIEDPNLRMAMVSDTAMAYWARAFTHISFSYMINYEELEKLGDAMLGGAIVDYIFRRDPTLRANEVNNIKSRYASKSFQASVSEVMGLATFLRHDNTSIDVDMREDLMEAFVGALFRTANLAREGLGYVVVFNFVHAIYRHVQEFDASLNSKTAVDQIFIAAGWGTTPDKPAQPLVTTKETESGYITTISLTPKAFNTLSGEGKWSGNNRVIGTGEKRDTKTSVLEAYDNAYKTLLSIGVDERYASNKKFTRMLYNAQIPRDKIDAVFTKIKELGFDYVDMKQKQHNTVIIDMVLIGFRIEQKTRTRSAETGVILAHYNENPEEPYEQDTILPWLIDKLLQL